MKSVPSRGSVGSTAPTTNLSVIGYLPDSDFKPLGLEMGMAGPDATALRY